ncbi:MAG: ABC transporter ATP-binding protein [Planctomycetota bacterium]|nr:ABC transporter ATP-binding protein [Planctomycetota bacterium]
MPAPLIDITDAWKIYRVGDVEIPAVRGVSLSIRAGQFLAITGASGSGKSTFLHLIGCLGRLTRGSYAFEGRATTALSGQQLAGLRNQRIGFVFQNFNLMARTTVLDNVALPLAYQGMPRRARRRRAEELLTQLDLQDRLKHHPNQLSGGQQQRVAIARALITRPAVILADEPTGNLDSRTGAEIMSLFAKLHREENITIIVVTHEAEVTACAERHIVFRDGEIISDEERTATAA